MPTTMFLVDETGHQTLCFDDTPAGVADAEEVFRAQRENGFYAFAGEVADGDLLRMDSYVPGFKVVYWVRPLVGG